MGVGRKEENQFRFAGRVSQAKGLEIFLVLYSHQHQQLPFNSQLQAPVLS